MRASRGFLWFGGLLLGAVIANAASCAALDSIQAGQCGNRVLDNGEDCDSVAPADKFDGGGKGVCGDQNAGAGACRFLCGQPLPDGGMGTSVCPFDEVCGSDGICRPDPLAGVDAGAVYQFSQLGPTVTTTAASLVSGDFDGDGLGDVIAITPVGTELLLGSSKGLSLASSTQLAIRGASAARLTDVVAPIDPRSPYAAPAAADPTDDLAFLFGGGIAVLTGQLGGTLTPAAYPKVDVNSPFFFAGFVYGKAAPPPGQVAQPAISTPWIFLPYAHKYEDQDKGEGCTDNELAFLYLAGKPHAVKCFMGRTQASEVSNAVLAPIHVDPSNACSQFVSGFLGDDHVSVFLPCDPGSTTFGLWTPDTTVFPIALPPGAKLAWGPLVYDVDHDGRLDIIAGSEDQMFVAYGTPTFHFTSSPGQMGTMDAADVFDAGVKGWELVQAPDPFRGPVLAVGDINGDGHPDFVTAKGLYVSTSPSGPNAEFYEAYQVDDKSAIGPSLQIESAAFGDFNGDGVMDVAFAVEKGVGSSTVGFPELTVLLTSSKKIGDLPLLDPYGVFVDAPVFHVVSGDFNGDGVADIGFAQTTDGTLHHDPAEIDKNVDTITVVYGDTGGNFFPVAMGYVRGIGGLLATDILFQGEKQFDGDSDLGVFFSFTTQTPGQKTRTSHNAAAVLPGQPGHLLIAPLGLLDVDPTGKFHQATPLAVAAGQFNDPAIDPHLDFGSLSVQTSQAGAAQDELELWRTPLIDNAIATPSTFTPLGKGLSDFGVANDASSVFASATSFPLGSGGEASFIAAIAGFKGASVYFGPQLPGGGFNVQSIGLAADPSDLSGRPVVRVEAAKIGENKAIVVLVGTKLFILSDLTPRDGVSPAIDGVLDFALLPRPTRDDSLILLATTTGVELSDGMTSLPVQGIPVSQDTMPLAVAAADVDGDRLPDVIVATHQGVTTFRMLPDAFVGTLVSSQ